MSRKLLLLILIVSALVNLVGAFGPELGFDALWYHLTIPKLYLAAGKIYHIPGGLLYYSELPRLAEMLYAGILGTLGNLGVLGIHLLNWGAGIGAAVITYKLARKFGLSSLFSLLSAAVFYVTPLLSWQSGSGYVDLLRTFFEVLALYLVVTKRPVIVGIAIGLAISTKTLALGSLGILGVLGILVWRNWRSCLLSLFSCLLVIVPWFVLAYLNTGFPFYPIGAGLLDSRHSLNLDLWNLPKVVGEFWKLFVVSEDPISPIYFLILPFLFLCIRKLWPKFSLLIVYCTLAYFVWYVTPRTGGGRFILPYLPVWAVLVGATIAAQKDSVKRILVGFTCLILLANLSYRAIATSRIFPYLAGRQTQTEYLCQNLDLKTTFVDCNGELAKKLKPADSVLVAGFHNLFYVNFPFIHESWYRGESYNILLSP